MISIKQLTHNNLEIWNLFSSIEPIRKNSGLSFIEEIKREIKTLKGRLSVNTEDSKEWSFASTV